VKKQKIEKTWENEITKLDPLASQYIEWCLRLGKTSEKKALLVLSAEESEIHQW